jgi:hypothetical protein
MTFALEPMVDRHAAHAELRDGWTVVIADRG